MSEVLDENISTRKCPLEKNSCSFGCEFYFSEMVEIPEEVWECLQEEKKKIRIFHSKA